MANIINLITSGAGGLSTSADSSGTLNIQSAGSTVLALTSSGVAITGTLSATSITGAGGMTLLGTLTTTSGTTQTLSGLTLTGYKYLQISINNVSGNATGFLRMAGLNIQPYSSTAAQSQWGTIQIDLTNSGAFGSIIVYDQNTTSGTVRSDSYAGGGNCGYTTATTSISFDYSSAATFDSGTIKVYGVA